VKQLSFFVCDEVDAGPGVRIRFLEGRGRVGRRRGRRRRRKRRGRKKRTYASTAAVGFVAGLLRWRRERDRDGTRWDRRGGAFREDAGGEREREREKRTNSLPDV